MRLDLRRTEASSVFDASLTDAKGFASQTEIASSTKSTLMLRVKGDLNADELAAIQSVFTQASAIADEFFDGDIDAAFNASSAFAFDTEQLAKVKMKFREVETISASFQTATTYGNTAPAPVAVADSRPAARGTD